MTSTALLCFVITAQALCAALGYHLGWQRRGDWDEPYIRLAYRAGRSDLSRELSQRLRLPAPKGPPQC